MWSLIYIINNIKKQIWEYWEKNKNIDSKNSLYKKSLKKKMEKGLLIDLNF